MPPSNNLERKGRWLSEGSSLQSQKVTIPHLEDPDAQTWDEVSSDRLREMQEHSLVPHSDPVTPCYYTQTSPSRLRMTIDGTIHP